MSPNQLRDRKRLGTHALLALITVGACYLTHQIQPRFPWELTLIFALGYLALLFLAITLLLGPLQLRRRGRNPVNLDLRRDVGIWTGITGGLHALLGLRVEAGGHIARYFFTPDGHLLLNLFGLSNDLGAGATVILLALLALSNDWTLRRLRGPRWKFWQRLNYGLFPLAVAHTLGYRAVAPRENFMGWVIGALVVSVVVGQAWGIYRYITTRAQRKLPGGPGRGQATPPQQGLRAG